MADGQHDPGFADQKVGDVGVALVGDLRRAEQVQAGDTPKQQDVLLEFLNDPIIAVVDDHGSYECEPIVGKSNGLTVPWINAAVVGPADHPLTHGKPD